jgi:hypothetical protein
VLELVRELAPDHYPLPGWKLRLWIQLGGWRRPRGEPSAPA